MTKQEIARDVSMQLFVHWHANQRSLLPHPIQEPEMVAVELEVAAHGAINAGRIFADCLCKSKRQH